MILKAMMEIEFPTIKELVQEQRQCNAFTKKDWVNILLHDQMGDDILIQKQLGHQQYKVLNNLAFQVLIIELENTNQLFSHLEGIIQSIFEQHGYQVFVTVENNQLVLLAFHSFTSKNTEGQLTRKKKLQWIVKELEQTLRGRAGFMVGAGSCYKGLNQVHVSYVEAQKANALKKSFYQKSVVFYEELGVFQLLLSLQEVGLLESYVANHLGPLVEEDRKKNSDLLKTLKVYLNSNGCKKTAADELHIVRQSIYYRLDKIKKLLGEDFMETPKRLALQLAIQAYELLENSSGDAQENLCKLSPIEC